MVPYVGKMNVFRVCLGLIGISLHHVSCLSTIRLIGGSKPNQGRLEISQSSATWGDLCGNSWTIQNTEVVCRQLGFPGAVTFSSNTSPLSTRVIHPFGYISCLGNESTLSSCSSSRTECQQVLSVDITCQDFGYVGCYAGPLSTEPTITDPLMTNDLCIKECRALYASPSISHAILNETACFCSSSLAGLTRKNDLFCYILCPGNREQSCGGPDVYTVFQTDVGFCVDPPTPILGIVTLNSSRYGSIVEFSCLPTYELIGNNKLQCLGDTADSLKWNGDYPSCAERRFVTLGLVFCSLGAILVFISMVCAVCGDIRRKMRKGKEGVDTEMLTSPIIQEQDTTNIRWNAQTNTVQQTPPPPVSASSVAPSRPLPDTSTAPASQSAECPHHPASVPTGTTPRSREYSGLYEDLDDYKEDIGGGTELTFERHPSEEESYEHSTTVSQTTATARSGERETEDDRGYVDARSDHRDLSGEQDGNEGYLEVLPEKGQPAEPSCSNQSNTYLEVIGEGEPSADRVESGHDYTYIANNSKVDRRPQLPLPRQHTEEDGQPDYDDTSVQPIYKNEGAMYPRPRRPDLGQ